MVVPAGWRKVRLGECLTIMHGKNQSQIVDPEGRYPILATGGVIGRTDSYLSNKPSVLIGRKGTIDKPQYMDTPFWTVDTLFYSEVRRGNSAKFLFYKFLMVDWKKYNEASGVPSLNASTIESVEILMPPLQEQEAIAEALSDADAAIESLAALIAKKRDVKQATMQQLLTGRTRLPGFTADWKEVSIGSFTDCKAGGTPSTSVPAYWGGDIRWMSSGELNLKRVREVSGRITQAGLENSSAQFFPADSVLIGLAGQGKTRGTAAFNLVGLTTNQSIAAILPSARHDSKFLFYVMETKYKELRDLSDGGGGRGGLNLTIIKDVRVTVPELDEQEKVSEILWSMDDELDALTEQVSKLRMVKEGMMQDLLKGKVRLV